MTQVGIFGDTLVPQGPEAAEAVVNEEVSDVVVEEVAVSEETPDFEEAAEDFIEEFEVEADESTTDTPTESPSEPEHKTAHELVSEIEVAETVEEVEAIADGVEFKTVIAAAEKRTAELS